MLPRLRDSAPESALPRSLYTPLPPRIHSEFSVFRRSTRPSDQPPQASLRGGSLQQTLGHEYELSRFYPHYVREVVHRPDGKRFFIVPTYLQEEGIPPARCFAPGERRRQIEQEQRRRVEPAYCALATAANARVVGLGCEPFAAVDEGGAIWASVPVIRTPRIELAPDGVAAARISYGDRKAIVVHVEENASA